MVSAKILLAVASLVLLADLCQSATIRDSLGRQINFPDSETVPESDGGQPQSRGFLQRIFDMIKNLFGFGNSTTTVMRSDGTVEEVPDTTQSGGFLSRMSNRLFSFIQSILGVLTGDSGSPRLDGYRSRAPSSVSNEIERELMKMAKNQGS